MNKVFTKRWLKAALIRAVKTVAQTAVATIGTAAMLDEVNWIAVASAAALAGEIGVILGVIIHVIVSIRKIADGTRCSSVRRCCAYTTTI